MALNNTKEHFKYNWKYSDQKVKNIKSYSLSSEYTYR